MTRDRLAIEGGSPVRKTLLPYGRQSVDADDVEAVVDVLRSDWLTTGPAVPALEEAFAAATGARFAVAMSNGTAALHAIAAALGVGPGNEVVVPALTFAATANCVLYAGGTPVFADVHPDTLLVDPESVAAVSGPRTRAVIAVDYAGQPCDYAALDAIAAERGLRVAADACHALGADDAGRPVGTLAELSAFSLHPVKHVTSGEGGVVTTADEDAAETMRRFRNHGMTSDARARERSRSFAYEIASLGFNYRLTDIQCALGTSQLRKLNRFVEARRRIAERYDDALRGIPAVEPLAVRAGVRHAYHLYVVRLELERLAADRAAIFAALRAEGIGVNVHYLPVHLHTLYRERLGTKAGLCPVAETAYERILTLPLFPGMKDGDVEDVVTAVDKVVGRYLIE